MTATEVLAAWKSAGTSGIQFYPEFERLTGFTEADVRKHFAAWNKLPRTAVDEIAAHNGVTVQDAGFQAYLADVSRGLPPAIPESWDEPYQYGHSLLHEQKPRKT